MNRLLATVTTLSVLLGAAPFLRPRTRAGKALIRLPKKLGGALWPITGATGGLAAMIGVARRDWRLVGAGLMGAGLAARLVADLPNVDQELAGLPGLHPADGPGLSPNTLSHAHATGLQARTVQRDLIFGQGPESGEPLRADLWPPAAEHHAPSELGLIYIHGGGWRMGHKDKGTRPFFRRLTAQGHLVLDINYSLWPVTSLAAMVNEVNQAILWLKENGPAYGIEPHRIVLVGGSAGGHLALLAAYTAGHPAFRPTDAVGDTSVLGVVAFYPPVDLLAWEDDPGESPTSSPGQANGLAGGTGSDDGPVQDEGGDTKQSDDFLASLLGGTAAEIPDTYRLLSPISHVGPHCPPTLLLQGSDDLFDLAPSVRRLHESLLAAGVPSALVEFPHTEHGFDLLLPQISPTARAATRGVEQFLAWLQ